ncbi:adenine phosphoribosyltransferase [Pseudodesulfovibrio thermohalotolerans]|uniref:adenine phosphoribosyltransferase n=1 Tax=Pseudodesulfovibrio thermohalotolerans TaxID=2880651 RepID=UPI002440F494|nr:adenine phosphoribosyltransferase [Pseudodesulfovibrio thermohalotolerans]WFS60963.1 adenine phosphoribosyltransferase [Pseudodesulfovibrio thermohalotolerans]
MNLRHYVRDIPDYPKKGITFYDITPILSSPKAFGYVIDQMYEKYKDLGINKIVAADARGFIFGAPLALKMDVSFVPIRKPGKLPFKNRCVTYDLEYGSDTLCMHVDAIEEGDKVLLIDDLLATGGTAEGMIKLVREAGGDIVGAGFVIQLSFLDGDEVMRAADVKHDFLLEIE